MERIRRYIVPGRPVELAAAFLLAIQLTGSVLAQSNGLDSTRFHQAIESISDLDQAIQQCEELIAKYPDSDFTPTVMFQLLELYYRKATEEYQARMEDYERELARFERGEISVEPTIPRVSYTKAIQIGYKLLDRFPTAGFIDKVIYRLGICQLQEGNQELAIEFFKKLADEYTYSSYNDEANFRLAEQYFDQRNYEEAIKYYSRLMDRWESPFFDMALYKLGWSYYNIDEYTKSISTFIFLIDDLSRLEKANDSHLGKTTADLREDAVTYVAECFAELGGARKLEAFLKEMGEKPYSQSIFLRLAEIYQKRNFYDESNEAYAALLRLWPLYEKAPEVQAKIIENYLKIDDRAKAEAAREALVENYGPGSEWLRKFPEGEAREQALKLVEENLYILGTEAQRRAMKSKSARDFSLAIARYNEFLEKFPESPNASKVQFYQAECYFELADYYNASRAYENLVLRYPSSEFAPQAAYNRVVATINLIQNTQTNGTADTTTIYIKDFLGTGEMKAIVVPDENYREFLTAVNDFSRFFPDNEKVPEVLMKLGETLFSLGHYDLAREAYTMVVNRGSESKYILQAYSMIGQSAFKQEDFVTAEKWYRRILEEFPDSTRYVKKAETMIASAKFKLAESLKSDGKLDFAAQAFENIAAETENSEIAERALLEAAIQYEKAGKLTKAIIIYENLRYRFPNSSKVSESLFKAATLAEELPDYKRAAENYLELFKLSPHSIYAPRALFRAAICFENLQDYQRAAETYKTYVKHFRDEPDQVLEALVKIGNFALNSGDVRTARQYYVRVLEEYHAFVRQGKTVDEYMPAEAQYKLGEIYFEQYRQIELVEPLVKNLKRKQKLFEQVVLACQNAAKYKVADWTTAALYRIGSAYEEFGRAFLESPRPKLADQAAMAKYEESLRQKVTPLKEKALETYRKNLQLAEENNIQNSWVQLTRERVEKLTVELGLSNGAAPTSVEKQTISDKSRYNER